MLLQFALTALIGASAHASSPFGDCVHNTAGDLICIDQKVIDTSNAVGTVRSVYNNGKVIVQKEGYSSNTTYEADSLSPETQCTAYRELCRGDTVIDTSNTIAVVQMIFRNGQVRAKKDGYSSDSDYAASSLSRAVEYLDQLQIGTRVIDLSNTTGYVTKIFANGKIKMKKDGYSSDSDYSLENLSYSVSRSGRISVGDRVIDTSNIEGTVMELFADGRAKVKKDGYSSHSDYHVRDLSAQSGRQPPREIPGPTPGQPPRDPRGPRNPRNPNQGQPRQPDFRIRKGDRVIDASGITSTVVTVYRNGKVTARKDGYSSTTTYQSATLGKGTPYYRGFYVGDRVIDSSNIEGEIIELFMNGKATVRKDGYSSTTVYDLSQLSN